MGTLNQHPSNGDTHPVANLAAPKAIADGIESGPEVSKPPSEKDAPEVTTTPTPQWCSREMDQEVESLTREHGYGNLPADKGILLPTRFPDTVTLKK